jgi:S1-C subfamily serine protease
MSIENRPFRPEPRGSSHINWLLVCLLVLAAILLWRTNSGRIRPFSGELHDPAAESPPITPRGDLAEDEKATIELFKRATLSVVHITSLQAQRNLLNTDVLGIPQGSGSGFVWNSKGYIVTNYHVIESADAAKVTLHDNSTWDARLVGKAPDKDLAVLKIDAPAERLIALHVGTSHDLAVGQKVFAIGNPFGLDHTLTTGVISGLGREIMSLTNRPIQGAIQIDAAINPGNSGGPLLDSSGRLIGMNTAIYSPSGASAGVGFAVPVDIIRRFVPQIIRTGKVDRIGIGVNVWDDSISEGLRRKGVLQVPGVLVRDVFEGGPAAEAGFMPTWRDTDGAVHLGDLIVAVDGKPVRTSVDLFRILDQHHVGDKVTITVLRGNDPEELTVTLRNLD